VSRSTAEDRFRPLGRGTFVGGILVTVALHLALGALVYFSHVRRPPPAPVVRDIMVTRLIHLGKPRDKFYLPRIVEPPRPKAPPPTIKVTEDLNAAPAKKETPRPPDPQPSKEVNRALERARELARHSAVEEPPEGSLTGSPHGTASQASEGDEYATAVYEAIRKNWSVPAGLSVGEVINLETEISVSIGPDGALLRPNMTRSSGNSLYDDSCMTAIQATGRVPPPPPAARQRFRRGVVLQFGGKDLAR
jgi:outer membrane biosynthesis protein TonB